jgi:U3 small nucleolar RNA-associated protein 10
VDHVFYEVFFPFLLYSKPRQHTAKAAWEIICGEMENGIGVYELLKGCRDVFTSENRKDELNGLELMINLNKGLAAKIAGTSSWYFLFDLLQFTNHRSLIRQRITLQ